MNKTNYIAEIKRQLTDTETYRPLKGDPTGKLQSKLNNLLTKFVDKGTITKTERDFIYIEEPAIPVI